VQALRENREILTHNILFQRFCLDTLDSDCAQALDSISVPQPSGILQTDLSRAPLFCRAPYLLVTCTSLYSRIAALGSFASAVETTPRTPCSAQRDNFDTLVLDLTEYHSAHLSAHHMKFSSYFTTSASVMHSSGVKYFSLSHPSRPVDHQTSSSHIFVRPHRQLTHQPKFSCDEREKGCPYLLYRRACLL